MAATKAAATREWRRYREQGDRAMRNRLVESNLGLVRHFANRLARRLGAQVEVEELVSAGSMGLIRAVESYDPDRGSRFSTYAAPLIRGAMLDELRRRDSATRSSRRRGRQLRDAESALVVRLGRKPYETELAEELGIEASTVWSWRTQIVRSERVSLDAELGSEGEGRVLDVLSDEAAEDVEDRVERDERSELLRRELSRLDERDRRILTLYYFEGLKQREIGELLGLTESRISQLRSKAEARIRSQADPALALAA